MSYYRVIKGIRYERRLLEEADTFVQSDPEGQISLEAIQALYQSAKDGIRITEVELRTLAYIHENYPVSGDASSWLADQGLLNEEFDLRIQRVVQGEFGLEHLQWQIEEAEFKRQEELLPKLNLGIEHVLRSALKAFIDRGVGYLNLSNLASTREEILEHIDMGKLYLYPLDYDEDGVEVAFELPQYMDLRGIGQWWIFQLEPQILRHHRFIAYVKRDDTNGFGNSTSFMTEQGDPNERIKYILRDFLGNPNMKHSIDVEEAERQMQKHGEHAQSWTEALLVALHDGIYNGESSISFFDYVALEEWYEKGGFQRVRPYIQSYLKNATVWLIPEDYATKEDFTPSIPENVGFYFDTDWYFTVDIPQKPDWRPIINKSRNGSGIGDSWVDIYVYEELSIEERLPKVITEEFSLTGLDYRIDMEEVARQHEAYDPQWRSFTGVIRQALNTILRDFSTPESVFQIVSEVHAAEIKEGDFPDLESYLAEIREKITHYLNEGILDLVPESVYDIHPDAIEDVYPPEDGEGPEQRWVFQLRLPTLSDHIFWVICPRYPGFEGEGKQPYCYGFN